MGGIGPGGGITYIPEDLACSYMDLGRLIRKAESTKRNRRRSDVGREFYAPMRSRVWRRCTQEIVSLEKNTLDSVRLWHERCPRSARPLRDYGAVMRRRSLFTRKTILFCEACHGRFDPTLEIVAALLEPRVRFEGWTAAELDPVDPI